MTPQTNKFKPKQTTQMTTN